MAKRKRRPHSIESDDSPIRPVYTDQRRGGINISGMVSALGHIVGGNLTIFNFPAVPWWAVVIGVAIAVTLAIAFWVYPLLRGQPIMPGDINVAVAAFGEWDTQGKIVESKDGYALAQSFSEQLEAELERVKEEIAKTGTQYDLRVWGPAQTPRLVGATPMDREQSAKQVANAIQADVIVYGNLKITPDQKTSFVPEFYISDRKLRNAEELAGQHTVDSKLQVDANIKENVTARADVRNRLLGGPRALANFIIGLSNFILNRFEAASTYFQQALVVQAVNDPEVTKIFYLFAGKSAHELRRWDEAMGLYSQALKARPDYARAQMAFADTEFQKAKDGCEKGSVDATGLDRAIDDYQKALQAGDRTEVADIEVKVSFYLGRAYLCQSMAGLADHWNDAERELNAVIQQYNRGNQRTKEQAADAHSYLGIYYTTKPITDASLVTFYVQSAIAEYHQAITLTSRADRQSVYYGSLAEAYEYLHDYAQADWAWSQAIQLDLRTPSPYQQKHQDFIQKRPGTPGSTVTPKP